MRLSRFQAREIDRIVIEEIGIPGVVLMENAARGVTDAVVRARTGMAVGAAPVAVLCGPGNNGGDGLAVARMLAIAGLPVRLTVLAPTGAYREGSDAAIQLRVAKKLGLTIRNTVSESEMGSASVIVDALFGTGLTRPLEGPHQDAVQAMNGAGRTVIAVDIPSGLDADTGNVLGAAVRATITATMVAPKQGFALGDGPAHTGEVRVVDIGVPPTVLTRVMGNQPR